MVQLRGRGPGQVYQTPPTKWHRRPGCCSCCCGALVREPLMPLWARTHGAMQAAHTHCPDRRLATSCQPMAIRGPRQAARTCRVAVAAEWVAEAMRDWSGWNQDAAVEAPRGIPPRAANVTGESR